MNCDTCTAHEDYRCTERDVDRSSICTPCAQCGKVRKHHFASMFCRNGDGSILVFCSDTCARLYHEDWHH